MPHAVGIDLGTTNSVISVFRQRGETPETLRIDGRPTFPSVVSFHKEGTVLVGFQAKARLLVDPENTVASVKRFMGDRRKTFHVGGESLSPVNVSSIIIKRLIKGAKETLGEEVWDAVITVPAYFTEAQREDTKRAGEEAGINVLRLMPEPTAAAIAYGLDKDKDQTILVYDLGGGTFDVSILEVKSNSFQVRAVGGDSRLGGDDLDEALMEWASKQFQDQTGINLMDEPSPEGRITRQRLKETVEAAKIELSESTSASISMPNCLGKPLDLEISLAEYNKIIEPFLGRTINCIKNVLKDAKLSAEDIDRVILVGGSTKNRAVREVVTQELKDPYTADRVDEAVSHGAAIMASNMFLPVEDSVPIEVSDVIGHSLGVDMLDEKRELVFNAIIPRQTTYPCRSGILGATNQPYQDTVVMHVFRGENSNPGENTNLGELTLPITPPSDKLIPIGAIFELDKDGIIHFTAVQFPLDPIISPIFEYSKVNNGKIDLTTVDSLIEQGKVKTKTVQVRAID